MLAGIRPHVSRIAVAVLVSLAAMGGSALVLHADDCHGGPCLPIAVEHDASAQHVRGAVAKVDAPPLHCLVCHWVRSFRPHAEVRIVTVPDASPGRPIHHEVFTAASAGSAAQPPLRSPPAAPVLA
jgi:hypothetical protein